MIPNCRADDEIVESMASRSLRYDRAHNGNRTHLRAFNLNPDACDHASSIVPSAPSCMEMYMSTTAKSSAGQNVSEGGIECDGEEVPAELATLPNPAPEGGGRTQQ